MRRFVADVQRCYFGKAPTIAEVNAAYGEDTGDIFYLAQLRALNLHSGARVKMTAEQIADTASVLAYKTQELKLTEIILFFFRLRMQHYAQFYGSVDPDVIVRSLNSFMRDREAAQRERDNAEREARYEAWRREAVTYDEYLAWKAAGELQ